MNPDLPHSMPESSTLIDLLRWRALHQPLRRAYAFWRDGEVEDSQLTYGELDRQARGIAAWLQDLGLSGERALLLYAPGLEFIAAVFGCLYAGLVAVPAYPPRPNRSIQLLQGIIADALPALVLTTASMLSRIQPRLTAATNLAAPRWFATDAAPSHLAEQWRPPVVDRDTLALVQYTSGSTRLPRGVMLTHANLLDNSDLILRHFEHTPDSRAVSWLPPYHDMGLIGGVVQPLYGGFPITLMSPVAFLQRPFSWLQAISRTQATTSGGPNFAYDLCARKITPAQLTSLDLSSWTVAFNGSEPVRAETLDRFATTFAPSGFRREAFYPCYGLAEGTLLVSGGKKGMGPFVHAVQGMALEQNRAVAASAADRNIRTLVSSGRSAAGQTVVIVDPERFTERSPEQVGEIWVSGPSVARGYWNRPEEKGETFGAYLADTGEGPFLRTGDLGFFREGELFVAGRLKDLIISAGRNHYPQDIESTVERSHPALQPGGCAAFAVDADGEERLVIVAEVGRHRQAVGQRRTGEREEGPERRQWNSVAAVGSIRQALAEQHELRAHAIVLVKVGEIPKTSSGKIRRQACRTAFLAGNLSVVEG
jgi:acyl-CoA synthetase (AMP-forming)/AMP-acid ligase II